MDLEPKQIVISLFLGVLGLYYLGKWLKGGVCRSKAKLNGKTVVVTGCNTGIGKETVKDLTKRGARVIMACRNLELANKAADDIRGDQPDADLMVTKLDLADLESVRACAAVINESEEHVDILINNAGIMWCEHMKTKDGLEMQMGTNHFGHFLFTNLLLDKLKSSAPSRIVTVSSKGHFPGYIDLDDINFEKRPYSRFQAYFQSKLANILFTRELTRRLEGTGVTCYSLHPGMIATDLPRHFEKMLGSTVSMIFRILFIRFLKTPTDGAQTSIYCAVEESLANESGKYYEDCHITKESKRAQDDEMAKKLWSLSEKTVNLKN